MSKIMYKDEPYYGDGIDPVTPLIDLPDYQTTGSVDKELYDGLNALGWLSECFANGKLKLKKVLAKILGTGVFGIQTRMVTWSVTVSGGGNVNTNLKTLIDADLPSGYKCLGVAGYTTNDVNILPVALKYHDSVWSLQLRNIGSSSKTTTIEVYYLCAKVGDTA